MMLVKTGRLSLPAGVADFYSDIARRHGVAPEALMAEALRRVAGSGAMPPPAPEPAPDPPASKIRSHFSEAEVERLLELNAAGWNDVDIARELGRSQPAVWRHRTAAGRPANAPQVAAVSPGRPRKVTPEPPALDPTASHDDATVASTRGEDHP